MLTYILEVLKLKILNAENCLGAGFTVVVGWDGAYLDFFCMGLQIMIIVIKFVEILKIVRNAITITQSPKGQQDESRFIQRSTTQSY